MKAVSIFDPPMCCSTGVCGPSIDPKLVQFARDLQWLAEHGVQVERFNLAQQPQAFVNSETVKSLLASEGTACLPLILIDGEVLSRGAYPSLDQLAQATGLIEQLRNEVSSVRPALSLPVIQG